MPVLSRHLPLYRDFESRVVVISMLLLEAAALLRGSAALTVEGTRAWLHVIGSSLRGSDPKSLHVGGVTVAAVSGCRCLLSCLPSQVCMDIDLTAKTTRLPLAFVVLRNRTHGLSKNLGALRHFSKQDDTTEHRALWLDIIPQLPERSLNRPALMRAPVYPLMHLTLLLLLRSIVSSSTHVCYCNHESFECWHAQLRGKVSLCSEAVDGLQSHHNNGSHRGNPHGEIRAGS